MGTVCLSDAVTHHGEHIPRILLLQEEIFVGIQLFLESGQNITVRFKGNSKRQITT